MKNKKIVAIVHFLVLAVLIFWNYYSNTGVIDGKTVGSVSDKYDNLFTPAGYAFAIWGIIYLGLIVLAFYMLITAFRDDDSGNFILKAAPPLILAHIGNGTWLWFWLHEEVAVSIFVMLFILITLIAAVLRLNMERWDAPTKFMAFVWWPIDLYFGWICVATIANFSAYLGSIGWNGGLSEVTWTIIMISVATALGVFLIVTRCMREVGGVIIWALIAIGVRHTGEIQSIVIAAYIGAAIIGIVSGIHAYKNRATLPFMRKEG
ncbi:MAG: hypothetical protein ACJAUD_002752 [Crocinitomicaceae bacterium]|jgi:hypothetical protein